MLGRPRKQEMLPLPLSLHREFFCGSFPCSESFFRIAAPSKERFHPKCRHAPFRILGSRQERCGIPFFPEIGKDAVSNEVTVSGTNLAEPIKLTIGGPNKSKFKLSASELPITGGKFTVSFNSDEEGVHEAYVKLSSRGAADVYVPLSVNNTTADGIKSATSCLADIEVFNLNGLKLRESKQATIDSATEGLPAGVYVVKSTSAQGVTVSKVAVN